MTRGMKLIVAGFVLTAVCLVSGQQNAPKPTPKPAAKPDASASAAPTRVKINLKAFELAPEKKVAAVAGPTASSRASSDKHLRAMAPNKGASYSLTPIFQWGTGGSQRKFTVAVYRESGEEIFRGDAEGLQFRYPEAAARLEPGKTYYWTVEYRNAALTIGPSEPAYVAVLDDSERSALAADLATASDARAQARILCRSFVWYDCVAKYDELIAMHPQDADLYAARAAAFEQVPATAELARHDRELSAQSK